MKLRVTLPISVFALVLSASSAVLAAAEPTQTVEAKLSAMGMALPPVANAVANYVPAVRSGSLVFLAGHLARDHDGKVITGKLGRDLTEKDAADAARLATLAALATLKREIGELAKVKRIVRVGGFINATEDFKGHSQVLNGCSDLLVTLFGDRGRHARTSVGVASLPLGAAVEIEMIVEVE